MWSCLALFPVLAMGTQSIYISPALVTFPPNVDATNFYNGGTWNISTTYPLLYTTKNTLNYTNAGSMTNSPGWEFDFGSGSGGRTWSANFLNKNGATITENDVTITTLYSQGERIQQVGHLWVSATNIVNQGLLTAGPGGEIVLTGSNINLSHSGGLQITPISGTGSPSAPTNFIPDTAIYDEYWQATNGNLSVGGSPWDGTTLGAYSGGVSEPCGLFDVPIQVGPLVPNVVDSVSYALNPYILTVTNIDATTTDFLLYSNLYNQGVFVYTGTNNVTGQIRFLETGNPSNAFDIVSVQLASISTNVVTAAGQTNTFYFVDSFAASTNHGLAWDQVFNPGAACTYPTYRPAAYVVSRTMPVEYFLGFSPGLGVPSSTFFYDPVNFTNFFVTGGSSAAYSCLVDNVAAQVPPGGSITNLPGRVRIYANNLNLNQAHVRAEGQIVVQATNLITSANAIMDCQNLSYNLGSPGGSLNFTNLALPSISRMHGTCDMVTAVWSNYIVNIYRNYSVSTSSPPVVTESDITNVTRIDLSLTAMDASGLQVIVPVTVQDLVLHSTNIVVSDSVSADQSFLLDGLSATLLGDVTFFGALQNWTYANAPRLRYFTNNGILTIPNTAHFGDDGPSNYLAFVNNGVITAGGQSINSSNLQVNSGGVNFCNSGSFVGVASTVQLQGAVLESLSDMSFFANNLLLNGQTTLAAFGTLSLTVTNSLNDAGPGSGNAINCQNGFNLLRKPSKGALLGTAVNSYAPLNTQVNHVWAGTNLLATEAGYVNNAALGTLALIPEGVQLSGYDPAFAFYGVATGVTNGLYVSNLDLSSLLDYYDEINIETNMVIYYKTVTLNTNVNTGAQTPEQFLDGKQFLAYSEDTGYYPGGYMRRVGLGGLATPKLANYGKMTGSYNAANGHFQLMVTSASGSPTFVIQASADLKNWVPIYTNDGPFGFYIDPDAGSYPYRFYRTAPGH